MLGPRISDTTVGIRSSFTIQAKDQYGNPRSSVTVFGAFLTLPLLAWNGWNAWSALGRGEGSLGTPGHLEGPCEGMRNVSAPEKGSGE